MEIEELNICQKKKKKNIHRNTLEYFDLKNILIH